MINKILLAKKQKYVPGIYGGLGPLAHIKFEEELVNECHRRGINKDQDYPVWILVNGSSTPDRTESINGGKNSLRHLIGFSNLLEKQGADFIVIACNTAHYYKNEIEKRIEIPILSLIDETASFVARNYPLISKVGIIATSGTIKSNLYQNALKIYGISSIVPSGKIQTKLMKAIYDPVIGIKSTGAKISGASQKLIGYAADDVVDKGAELIIAGCTELSMVFKQKTFKGAKVVDPIKILSSRIIDNCFRKNSINPEAKSEGYKIPKRQLLYADISVPNNVIFEPKDK